MSDVLKSGAPVSLAIFRSIDMAYNTIGEKWMEEAGCYARLSEYVEVNFPSLQDDAQIVEIVRALDNQREQTVREFTSKLAEIDRQKSQLLAITYQVEASTT